MDTTYTIFILLKALPAWLRLPRDERSRIADQAFSKALAEHAMAFRYFDAEAFSARASDVALFETTDLRAYYFAMEHLRDSPIFAEPYFEIVDIIPTIEDGYQTFEAAVA
tara:strand:+ start:366 stop:695 length:330 start_codon:yes stop_codon:yes gene_type:complete